MEPRLAMAVSIFCLIALEVEIVGGDVKAGLAASSIATARRERAAEEIVRERREGEPRQAAELSW